MKLSALFAAALVLVGAPIAGAAPAAAQRTVVHERTVVHHQTRVRANHHRRLVTRRVCTNRFDHGRRHRVCRTVRQYR